MLTPESLNTPKGFSKIATQIYILNADPAPDLCRSHLINTPNLGL